MYWEIIASCAGIIIVSNSKLKIGSFTGNWNREKEYAIVIEINRFTIKPTTDTYRGLVRSECSVIIAGVTIPSAAARQTLSFSQSEKAAAGAAEAFGCT